MSAADLRAVVAAAAGNECQCRGACGTRKHEVAGCPTDETFGPLHAVPREPVPLSVAVTLSAGDHLALCAGCAGRLGNIRDRARRERLAAELAASAESLFPEVA